MTTDKEHLNIDINSVCPLQCKTAVMQQWAVKSDGSIAAFGQQQTENKVSFLKESSVWVDLLYG